MTTRKLIVSMNITLDGYLSGPGCELDWHFKSWTQEMGDALCSQLAKADTILLGRVTYNAMAKYWPAKVSDPSCRGEDFAFANMMNSYTKIVFSKTIASTAWNNTKLLKGNLQEEISRLKKKPGKDIMVYGSGQLADALIKSGLVNEYQLWLHPVILGKGKPLFNPDSNQEQERLYLKMVNTKIFPSGVVMILYQSII
jgi:dihydrofolate reductase